jgi:hypothetical protein
MRAVVVTSVTPAHDLEHQMRCLRAWDDLGLTTRSANSLRDCDAVQAAGLEPHLCLPIPPRDTALDRLGAPAPRLVPLLRRVSTDFPGQDLILCRPGVYPALRSTDCIAHWLRHAPALALSVEQTPMLELYHFSDSAPCHSQMDAFVIGADRMALVADALEQWPVAEDMCLGDAGWDLLLTAVITSAGIGGAMADSAVLLRETDGRGPMNRAALGAYVPALRGLGLADAPDPLGAAEDCQTAIAAACAAQGNLTGPVKAFYFGAPAPLETLPIAATDLAQELLQHIPWVKWNYDIAILASLAQRILAPGPFGFARISAVLRSGPSQSHQISEALLAMLIWCRCCPEAAASLRPTFDATPSLAEAHTQSLHLLQSTTQKAKLPELRLALVSRAGQDMVDHGVWTRAMRDAVALSCQNDMDRHLFDRLSVCTRKVADAA